LAQSQPQNPEPESSSESALLNYLHHEPLHIDDIRSRASLPITEVSSLLTMLELKGLVKQVGCMHYIRIHEATPIYGN
jgi:DNA processing protein